MYDRQVIIYRHQVTKNNYQENEKTLVKLVTLRAAVNYRGGREGFYARQTVATGEIVFIIRHYPGIDEKMFIAYNGRMYNIKHIAEAGRREKLEITATMHDNMKVPDATA
jgi:SPP1 family predicted phage head-tail adaptor